ncbi:MAG TPA: hypothetical protein VI977_01975 [archaeon]|nr:hypothetical protein [archaeon]
MALLNLTKTIEGTAHVPARRISYFGLSREKRCMNCGKLIFEERDLYSRRFCSTKCKEEYCVPASAMARTV